MRARLSVLVLLSACNGVLGLEERTFDLCTQYCDAIQNSCVQANAQYQDDATCRATCALFEAGDADDPTGNTIACRFDQLKKAEEAGTLDEVCPAAGPGGFNRSSLQVCGNRCETYCTLMKSTCVGKSPVADLDDESCRSLCGDVRDNPAYDPTNSDVKDHDDSIQCRLWHLSVASTAPDPHCSHADGATKCDGNLSSSSATTSSASSSASTGTGGGVGGGGGGS